MQFTGLASVQAGDTSGDTVNGLAQSEWALGDLDNQVTVAGIDFTGVDAAQADNGRILGTAAADTFVINTDASIDVAAIRFTGATSVDGNGDEDTVVGSGDAWTSSVSNGALVAGAAETTVNGITLVISDIDIVTNAQVFNGVDIASTYRMSDLRTLELAGIEFQDVNQVNAGSASDTLEMPDLELSWTVNGTNGSISSGGQSFNYTGFENLQAGAANDSFNVQSGELTSINTGAGDDTVSLNGGRAATIALAAGNDTLNVNNTASAPTLLDGGTGNDQLNVNVADLDWNIFNPNTGINNVGDFSFTAFENLANRTDNLVLNTSFATVFDSDNVSFTGGGMNLTYSSEGNVNLNSSNTGGNAVSGRIVADELVIAAQGDIELETDVSVIAVEAVEGANISVDINADSDLVIRQIDAGERGVITLSTDDILGRLLAEDYFTGQDIAHLTAENIYISRDTDGNSVGAASFNEVGLISETGNLEIKMDVSGELNLLSQFYVDPSFVNNTPLEQTIDGEGFESLTGAQAAQIVRSAQTAVDDFAQVDAGIFEQVNPYSADADALGGLSSVASAAADAAAVNAILNLPPSAAGGETEGCTDEAGCEDKATTMHGAFISGGKIQPAIDEDYPISLGDFIDEAQGTVRVAFDQAGEVMGLVAEYAVQQGDTMSELAAEYLGDADAWQDLWARNPQVESPESMSSSDVMNIVVKVGSDVIDQVLELLQSNGQTPGNSNGGLDLLVPAANRELD